MQVCNYTMTCTQFRYDFADKNTSKRHELFYNHGLHSYFPIPKSEKFYIKISYPESDYYQDIYTIKKILWMKFILALLLLFVIALFFTFYSLRPIRKALKLNDEFIKDILHDFNTPITSMVLNIKMFTEEKGEDPFITRVSQGMNNILLLQNNLKSFLHHAPSQNTLVDIASLVKKRQKIIQHSYDKLIFTYEKNNDLIGLSNEDILIRIFDNILSNAAKYNKPNGEVHVHIHHSCVRISDTGKGIQNIDKVMQRYYKEQDRGVGLGLHIVQKLSDELNIVITIKSQVDKGTTFILDFKHLDKASCET